MTIEVSRESYERAVECDSAACLIADALKAQGYIRPVVDVATITFTDREAGERYTYLTPEAARLILLSFDQGWHAPPEPFEIRRAVRISPIKASKNGPKSPEGLRAEREAKVAALEAKVEAGETLTRGESQSLTKMRKSLSNSSSPKRPSAHGRPRIVGRGSPAVVQGGRRPKPSPESPHLIPARTRVFGSRLADPGKVFAEAVERELARREGAAADGAQLTNDVIEGGH